MLSTDNTETGKIPNISRYFSSGILNNFNRQTLRKSAQAASVLYFTSLEISPYKK